MKIFFLVSLAVIVTIFSCNNPKRNIFRSVMTTSYQHYVRQLDGKVVLVKKEKTVIFPQIELYESAIIRNVSDPILQTIIDEGETSQLEIDISIGVWEKVDYVGGKMITLEGHPKGSNMGYHFILWVDSNDSTQYVFWMDGGFGLSFHGNDPGSFKRALIASNGSADTIAFLDAVEKMEE